MQNNWMCLTSTNLFAFRCKHITASINRLSAKFPADLPCQKSLENLLSNLKPIYCFIIAEGTSKTSKSFGVISYPEKLKFCNLLHISRIYLDNHFFRPLLQHQTDIFLLNLLKYSFFFTCKIWKYLRII